MQLWAGASQRTSMQLVQGLAAGSGQIPEMGPPPPLLPQLETESAVTSVSSEAADSQHRVIARGYPYGPSSGNSSRPRRAGSAFAFFRTPPHDQSMLRAV